MSLTEIWKTLRRFRMDPVLFAFVVLLSVVLAFSTIVALLTR